jgi:hypothetical protein
VAALLRFQALGWGLRHQPDWDERVFVENVALMVRQGDLDHRYYEYPGLVFYLLAPAVAASGGSGPPAYLAARAVVAAFGVLAVALVFVVGRRLTGDAAALAAALLVAVSPIAVDVAHMVRPDVVLEVFVLLALLAMLRLDGTLRRDAVAGVALGAAVAVKFSGGLLVPSLVLARCLLPEGVARRPSRVLRGIAVAGGTALLTTLVCTPYAVLHGAEFATGVGVQVGYHYEAERSGHVPYVEMLRTYLGVLRRGLGPAAWLLLAAPIALVRDRRWAVLAAFPLVALLVFSTSDVKRDRFLVPAFGVLAVMVTATLDRGVRWMAERAGRPGIAPAVVAACALLFAAPLVQGSVRHVRALGEPGSRDRALDWIEAHVPAGSAIVAGVPDLGLDRSRYEVLPPTGYAPLDRGLVAHAGWMVAPPAAGQSLGGLREVYRVDGRLVDASPTIAVFAVDEAARPRLRRVLLEARRVRASENQALVPAMLDDDPATAWTTQGAQSPGQWLEVDLGAPREVRRIDLALGNRPNRRGALLRVFADDGAGWRRVRVAPGRPPVEEQPIDERGVAQILVLEPVRARALRVVQEGSDPRRWAVARLDVRVAEDAP